MEGTSGQAFAALILLKQERLEFCHNDVHSSQSSLDVHGKPGGGGHREGQVNVVLLQNIHDK